jgi:hypothetical protein
LRIDNKLAGEKCFLSSSTLPPPSNGRGISPLEVDEKTEEQYGNMKSAIKKTLQLLSKVRHRFDNCSDLRYPSTIITSKPIKKALLDIKNRSIKTRIITEITIDNLLYCKELMEVISELRHIDGPKGNFALTDSISIICNFIRETNIVNEGRGSYWKHIQRISRTTTMFL